MSEPARIFSKLLIRRRNIAFLFSLAQCSNDLRSFTVWELAVVIPCGEVTANPSFGPSIHSIEDVDFATTFLAAEFTHCAFARMRSVVLLHRAQVGVAFSFVGGMAEYRASLSSVFRWRAGPASSLSPSPT